ncbi:MAG: phage portal protein family [Rhizobium sp.]|nr:phage portal protein family [Rhizobium sp.]
MRLFGLPVPFAGSRQEVAAQEKTLNTVTDNRGGWMRIFEPFTGAWQHNIVVDRNLVLTYHAIFACETLIASDIAKLRVKLVTQDNVGIWSETTSSAYNPVLRKPNQYQNRIQFWENWILSKLNRGNTYVMKQRDNRNVVVALYVLEPTRVTPLVAEDGSVFYRLAADRLSGLTSDIVVPAREIIHDRMNCLFHPLVGISPIYASGLAATQGLNIQGSSARLFKNNSAPGGILTAPGLISEPTATRLKSDWEQNFSGENVGRVAVLGDGLKYEKMSLTAVEGQLIEQLKWTAEVVCSTFHVPPYKIGVSEAAPRAFANIQSLNIEYYSQCLQTLIEAAELCLDEGLELNPGMGTEFDLDGLLRMDSVTQVTMLKDAVAGSVMSPNEARARMDLTPVPGGESPLSQQQNYSLAALAKRDAKADPFASGSGSPALPAPAAQLALAPPDASKMINPAHVRSLFPQKRAA